MFHFRTFDFRFRMRALSGSLSLFPPVQSVLFSLSFWFHTLIELSHAVLLVPDDSFVSFRKH